MKERALSDVIRLLVRECGYGEPLTRTKIMRLVYLTDVLSRIENGRTATGLRYHKYHRGPHAEEVVERIEALDDEDVIVVPLQTDYGATYDHDPYRPVSDPTELSEDEVAVAERVIDTFGDVPTKRIVEYVHSRPEVTNADKYTLVLGPAHPASAEQLKFSPDGEGQD